MKSLFLGVVLILLIGVGGFFYRNVAERSGAPEQTVCTKDAKVCPDGSAIGRTGPACEFVPCAFPNVEVLDAGLSFVVPGEYSVDENAYGAEPTLVAAFVKPSIMSSVMHTIFIRRYLRGAGETADDTILANTRYQPADMDAEDFSRFETSLINGKQFRSTVIGRFEGVVHSTYFLVRTTDVLAFEIIEHDVDEWTSPTLVIADLPEHKALQALLSTLQVAP